MSGFSSKSVLYDNIKVYTIDKQHISTTSLKKAKNMIEKGYAEQYGENSIRLLNKIERKLIVHPFDTSYKKSICVKCGTKSKLTKHHVVPYRLRRYFPLKYKSKLHHDLLVLCTTCHKLAEKLVIPFEKKLAESYGLNFDAFKTEEIKQKISLVKILKRYISNKSSELEKNILREKIIQIHGSFPNQSQIDKIIASEFNPSHAIRNQWKQKIESFSEKELQNFIRIYRKHFLNDFKPKYLPENWDLDYRL